jgi:hypothetical protein
MATAGERHYSQRYGRTRDPEKINPKSNGKVLLVLN